MNFQESLRAASTEDLQASLAHWASVLTPRRWELGDGVYLTEIIKELRSRGEDPAVGIEALKTRLGGRGE